MELSRNILLVDDDFDDRELFVEALTLVDKNSQVTTLDGSEGLMSHLDKLEKLPDYVFLDLNMPRKSGKECLREIQRTDRFRSMKIVIYSTSINPRDVMETYEYGAFCFVQKPNSFAELKNVIRKVINSTDKAKSLDDGFVVK